MFSEILICTPKHLLQCRVQKLWNIEKQDVAIKQLNLFGFLHGFIPGSFFNSRQIVISIDNTAVEILQ